MKKIRIVCQIEITDEDTPDNPEKWQMDQTALIEDRHILKIDLNVFFAIATDPGLTKENKEKSMGVLMEVFENSGIINDEKDLTRLLDHMEANEGILDDLPADIEKI